MTKKELVELLVREFRNGNTVDLSNLDFSKYEVSVYINCMKVNGVLFQSYQEVSGKLYQHNQRVGSNLIQSHSSVGGDLFQEEQFVRGDLYQGQSRIHGKIYCEKDIKVKNRRKKNDRTKI